MTGFGAGMGGMGSVCGALVGGVAALSTVYGRGALDEKEDPKLYPLCGELYGRFGTEIEESHLCRDITGTDFTDPQEARAFFASPDKLARCTRLVGKTADTVLAILAREGVDKAEPR